VVVVVLEQIGPIRWLPCIAVQVKF
jgi:hypothetical protein